jgi:excisionase family DNA binding protein
MSESAHPLRESDSDFPRLSLRPKEAAKSLGIGERLLWSKTNSGEIPHLRIGTAVVYPVAALEQWLAEQAKGGER